MVGSRRVIKDVNSGSFYGEDIYTREGLKYEEAVPRGFVVYGELIGWASADKPIQKNYTYGLPRGQAVLYVYRVATITPDGILTDLSWPAVKAFCHERGLNHVPEMYTTSEKFLAEEEADSIRDSVNLKFFNEHNDEFGGEPWVDTPVRLDDNSPCDEGLVIRVDNERSIVPEFYKAKAQQFLEHESKLLDNDEEILS